MDITSINIGTLLTSPRLWITLFAWFMALFLFWRSVKNEIDFNWFYKFSDRVVWLLATVYVIAYITKVSASFLIYPTLLIYLLYSINKTKFDVWWILDSLCIPMTVLAILINAGNVLSSTQKFGVITIIVSILYLIFALPFLSNHYRAFSWYPSGKNGFLFLFTNLVGLFYFLLIALLKRSSLYWEKFALVIIFLVFLFLFYRRSGRNLKQEIKDINKRLGK